MKDNLKFILLFSIRVVLYATLMVLLNVVFIYDASHITSTGKFGENSGTELMQEGFLFILGLLFIIIGRLDRNLTAIANLTSLFFFMAFIREFNNQISYWFYLEIPLILAFCGLLYHYRKHIIPSLEKFLKNPAIPWFVIGFLVTFVFSRFFGRTRFWETLLEGDYNRWAKNAGEEGIELLGYSLIFISGIELFIETYKNRKLSKQ